MCSPFDSFLHICMDSMVTGLSPSSQVDTQKPDSPCVPTCRDEPDELLPLLSGMCDTIAHFVSLAKFCACRKLLLRSYIYKCTVCQSRANSEAPDLLFSPRFYD